MIQKGLMYIFMAQLADRAREGIDTVLITDFKKCYDEEMDYHYWKRVVTRLTKNHQYVFF